MGQGGRLGPSSNEPLPPGVDGRAETLERSRSQEPHIAELGEYDLIHCFKTIGLDDCVTNVAGDNLAIGHAEGNVSLTDSDPRPVEPISRNPGKLRTRINEEPPQQHVSGRCPLAPDDTIHVNANHAEYPGKEDPARQGRRATVSRGLHAQRERCDRQSQHGAYIQRACLSPGEAHPSRRR